MNTEQRERNSPTGTPQGRDQIFNSLNAHETLSESQEQREPIPMPKLAR